MVVCNPKQLTDRITFFVSCVLRVGGFRNLAKQPFQKKKKKKKKSSGDEWLTTEVKRLDEMINVRFHYHNLHESSVLPSSSTYS